MLVCACVRAFGARCSASTSWLGFENWTTDRPTKIQYHRSRRLEEAQLVPRRGRTVHWVSLQSSRGVRETRGRVPARSGEQGFDVGERKKEWARQGGGFSRAEGEKKRREPNRKRPWFFPSEQSNVRHQAHGKSLQRNTYSSRENTPCLPITSDQRIWPGGTTAGHPLKKSSRFPPPR